MLISKAQKRFRIFNTIGLGLLTALFVFPVLFVVKTSFDVAPMGFELSIWPQEPSTLFYRKIFRDSDLFRPFINSAFVTVVGTAGSTVLNCMSAYTLSKRDLPGVGGIVYFLVVIPMFISGGTVPTYILYKSLGLLDTITVLWLPSLINAMNCIIIRNYFWGIPKSLQEAARIDGAGEFTVFLRIIIPLSKSVIAATALFTGVGFWNLFMPAILYISDPSKKTYAVMIREILFAQSSSFNQASFDQLLMQLGVTGVVSTYLNPDATAAAVTILSFLPILAVYPFLQKHFAAGMLKGSIKG